jgi:repressor LexA
MTEVLTRRQRQVLELIQRLSRKIGAPPTIRELKEGLKLNSLRGVTIHLDALVRKGYIERSRLARGIRVLGSGGQGWDPVFIPVVGRIAAGQPILAEQNIEERIAVDRRWVTAPGCFAVRVHGDSMVGAGIMEGDYVVVRPQQTAENGEIVAVLIDGEATDKRFYREQGGRIRLQPENPAVEPIFIQPRRENIQILGKVVGLFRRF